MKTRAIVTLIAAMSVALGSSALGTEMYPKMYDASYIFRTPAGESQIRVISDGNGKVREERSKGSYRSFSVTDYPSKTIYTVSEAIRLIKKAPLQQFYEGPMDAEMAKKKNAKDLGVKNINGLSCHGWSYKIGETETEIWLEKMADFVVLSKSRMQNGNIEMVLTSSSKATPSPELFTIPSNYKVVSQDTRNIMNVSRF